MIKILKTAGYNFVVSETLNNREFRQSNKSYTVDEDNTTLGKQLYEIEEEYELFLSTNTYSEKKMRGVLDSTRELFIDDINMSIVEQENGFLIVFTTTKRGM